MTTMDCWSVLELDRDADERSIKRQYARLLKINRPDDDPVAFQALRDAYEQALDQARNRVHQEEEDEEEHSINAFAGTITTPTASPPVRVVQIPHMATAAPLDQTEPLLRPVIETSWYERASLTTPQNLAVQREIARDQGCDEEFQQHLANRCLLDPHDHLELIQAAVAQLHWLTPEQKIRFRPHQAHRLTQALLENSSQSLLAMLEQNQEREFLDALKGLEQQPWLSSLDQHDQLEHWTMTLLLNSPDWSAALFERISDLFGWDQKHGAHSGTPSLWMHLTARCEKMEFLQRLQRLLAGPMDSAPAYAARLLLDPPSLKEQLRIAKQCDDSAWEACERLCFDLSKRYPELLEHFPNAELHEWRKRREQVVFRPKLRVYLATITLTIIMLAQQARTGEVGWSDVITYTLTVPLLILWGFYIAKTIWTAGCNQVKPLDMWLSKRVLPDFLSWPGYQAMVIRHGAPVIFLGSTYAQKDPLLLVAYIIAMGLWIYLSPYRISLISDAVVGKTGGWNAFKAYCARNTGRGVMIVLGLMLVFVLGVIIAGPGPRH